MLQVFLQREIFPVDVLEEHVVLDMLVKFFVLQAAILQERIDVIPVFFKILALCLAHADKLVRDFLGDIVGHLLDEPVILKCRTGYVQREIRAVHNTLECNHVLRHNLLDVVRDKDLIAVELDGSLDRLILSVDFREVQDSLHVERIIHVQMDPEQGLAVIIEHLAVEILVLVIGALTWCLLPERMDIGDGNRALVDLYHVLRRLDLDRLLAALSVILFTSHRIMMNRPDDNVVLLHLVRLHFLVFLRRILLAQEDLNRHEAAVPLQHLTHAVFIRKFKIVLIQMKRHAGADLAVVPIADRVGVSAITLPVNRLCILLVAQRIDRDHVRHHEHRIKAQSEMSDDVILVRLVLVLFEERCRA